jgi:two-component system OmpR family sensor kinase
MLRSLNSRLLLSYAGVILICLVLVLLGLFVFTLTSPLWVRSATLDLEVHAQTALQSLRETGRLETIPPGRLQELLVSVAEEQGVRILVLDNNEEVRLDSEGRWLGERLKEISRAPVVNGRIQGTFLSPAGSRWAYVGRVVSAPGRDSYTILFVSRPQMLTWFVQNLMPPVARAGAVALVLSFLLALLISRSIAAPLQRVAAAAEAISRGETGIRAPISGPAEVRALAHSFNAMANQVEAGQKSQRDFVANVSHELKTPLTSIQGFSQALLDGTASTPETRARAARVVHEEAERMRRLVDELLLLARFDAGQMVMARDVVELAPLLRGCVEKLAPQSQEADVSLALDVPEGVFVTGDADRLAQVFANLLDNGVSHTPPGGNVTLGAGLVGDGRVVEVTVTDSGSGIPAEEIPRIFERFYQVDKARKRGRGAGLGLAITKEIVEAHGGTIRAESVVGLGSKLSVCLPVYHRGGD